MSTMSEQGLVCSGCERAVETCSFCDAEDCGAAICHRCLIVDLKETIVDPHPHGG